MKFELEEYHRNVSDDGLLADLKRVAAELDKDSVTRDQYDERGKFNSGTFEKRFKGWLKALEKAGLKKTINRNISEEEFFQNLEETWIKLGRQPRYIEMCPPLSKYWARTYDTHFGTWRKALEKFVAYVNKEEKISSEEAIKHLKIDPSTRHKTKRGINLRLRVLVLMRDAKCKICGRSKANYPNMELQVDHIKAWANGGETVLENLQSLCSDCNVGKSNLK